MDNHSTSQDESGFSSDEEEDAKLREILNDIVVEKMFSSSSSPQESNGSKKKEGEVEKSKTFDDYLAHVLTDRLDREIDMVNQPPPAVVSENPINKDAKIQLLSTSDTLIALESNEDDGVVISKQPVKHHRSSNKKRRKDYESQAKEAAVTPEWVCEQSYTSSWEDPKKPRIMKLKLVRKHSDGKLECVSK